MLALLAVLALSGVGAAFATQSAKQATPSAAAKTYGCPPDNHGDDDDDGHHSGGYGGKSSTGGSSSKTSSSSSKTYTTTTSGGSHSGDNDDDGGGHHDDCPPPCPTSSASSKTSTSGGSHSGGNDDCDPCKSSSATSKTSTSTSGGSHSGGKDCTGDKPGCGPDKTDGVAGNSGRHDGQPPKADDRKDCPNPPGQQKQITTTGGASSVNATSASVDGSINPNGKATTVYFEYGKTTDFGSKTASKSVGSGTTAVAALASLSGLTKNTKYYFRLVASNSAGTATGVTSSFTTAK
jgi:hypothetical protein